MTDPIGIVESAYAASDATEAEWLGQLATSIASALEKESGRGAGPR